MSNLNISNVNISNAVSNQTIEIKNSDTGKGSVNKGNFDTVNIRSGDDNYIIHQLDDLVRSNMEKFNHLLSSTNKSSEFVKLDSIATRIATGQNVNDKDLEFIREKKPELLENTENINRDRMDLLNKLSETQDKIEAAKIFLNELQENKRRSDTDVQASAIRAKVYQNAWINYLTGSENKISNIIDKKSEIDDITDIAVTFFPSKFPNPSSNQDAPDINMNEQKNVFDMQQKELIRKKELENNYFEEIDKKNQSREEYLINLEKEKAERENFINELKEKEQKAEESKQELIKKQQDDEYRAELSKQQLKEKEKAEELMPFMKNEKKETNFLGNEVMF